MNETARKKVWQWDATDIRELRQRLDMTQTEFAKELGCHRITVTRWERGIQRPSPLAGFRLVRLNNAHYS